MKYHCLFMGACVAIGLAAPGATAAQELGYGTPDDPGEIGFNRPESWAMKYFTSVSLLTGLGVPGSIGEGRIVVGLEGALIPSLSDAQRTVGFNGAKLEDLNKSPAFGRVRVSFGLKGGAEFTLAYVPPVELGGAKPNLFAAAFGVPLLRGSGWRLGGRAYGQFGSIKGDFTCDEETVAAGSSPERNPYGCNAISEDRTTQTYVGVDLGVAAEAGRVEPYLSVGVNRFATKFETRAITNGTLDDSTFDTSGITVHGTAGVLLELTDAFLLSGEVFYSPLGVDRPSSGPGATRENDGLLNARGMISVRF